jgi:crotonobetainyl-CoA:carnitine CoA-transferase CaiB-like acyl-CoA transferase
MDKDDLVADPRFAATAARRQQRGQLEQILKSWARRKTRREIWDALRDLDYFGAPVLSTAEVLEDPHIKARQAFIERDHPTAGPTMLLAPWIHLSKTPASIRDDAPAIGQHTDEVLGKILCLSAANLSELRAQGVIR